MKPKSCFIALSLLGAVLGLSPLFAQQRQGAGRPQEKLPREVTVTEIPGVIASGAKWQQV